MPDDMHSRLKQMARARKVSVNKLLELMSSTALAEFDAETRFRVRAARGDTARGLALLDKLDAAYRRGRG
jgi:hypothetical protein